MSLLDAQIKSVLLDHIEAGGSIRTIGTESDRVYLTSQFLGFALLLESEQRTSKSIKNQVREEIVSYLENRAAAILHDIGLAAADSNKVFDRLLRVVSASKSGSRTTLLDVVRTFTGQTLPFSRASDCEWLNDEILEIFSDLFGVRSDWISRGEGSVCPPIKRGAVSRNLIFVADKPVADVEVIDSKLVLFKEKSVLGSQVSILVNVFSIKNMALAHGNAIESSYIVHCEESGASEIFRPMVDLGVGKMLPVFIADVGYSAIRDFLLGDITPNELVAKAKLQQANAPMIEAWYEQ